MAAAAKTKPVKRRRPKGTGTIIEKRPGVFYARIEDPVTGKMPWVRFGSREEADAHLARVVAKRKTAALAAQEADAKRAADDPTPRNPDSDSLGPSGSC